MKLDDLLAMPPSFFGPTPCMGLIRAAGKCLGLDLPEPADAAARYEALTQRGIEPSEFPTGWQEVTWPPQVGDVLVLHSHLGPSSHLAICTEPGWVMHCTKTGVIRQTIGSVKKHVATLVRKAPPPC